MSKEHTHTAYTNGLIHEALTLLSDFLSNPTGQRRSRLIEFMRFYQGEVLRGAVEPSVKIDLAPSFPEGEEVQRLSYHRAIFKEEEFADSKAYRHGRLFEEGPKANPEDRKALQKSIQDLRESERKDRKIKAIKDYIDLLPAKEKKELDVMALWALPVVNLKVMTTELRKARSEASKQAREEWKQKHQPAAA